MVQLVRHRQTKESATDRLNLIHRVTPRLHRSKVLLQMDGNATFQELRLPRAEVQLIVRQTKFLEICNVVPFY
jgi:hypothetical protein